MNDPQKSSAKTARLSPATAVAGTVAAFLLGQILGGVAVWLLASAAEALTPVIILDSWFESTPAQFFMVVLSGIFTLLILWFFVRRLRAGWRILGFGRKPKWIDLGFAFIGLPVYFVLLVLAGVIAGAFLGVDLQQEQEIGFTKVAGGADMFLAFVSLVVIPPIVEEVLFRGFMFTGLRSKLNFATSALAVSVLFALPHLFASSSGLLWVAAIDTFILSMVLCYLREKTGALFAPVVLHAMKNSAAFIFLFVA